MNDYLKETIYFTTILIAGNIKVADNHTIYVNFGKNLKSSNFYSCAVNGVVEAYHRDVGIYQFANLNDRPSIQLG